MKTHWVAEIFPLNPADVDRLAEDIKANGQRQPILTWKGEIIDGRTRFLACQKADVVPAFEEYRPRNGDPTDDELLALSWSLNEARRHLSTSQRACAAAEVIERLPEDAKGKGFKKKKAGDAISCVSPVHDRFDVNRETVRQARELLVKAPHLFALVKNPKPDEGLTVAGAWEAYQASKGVEAECRKRNSLAALRSKDPGLAEEVEGGTLSLKEAEERLAKREWEDHQRKAEIRKIADAISIAASGIELVAKQADDRGFTLADIVGVREPFHIACDPQTFRKVIEILNRMIPLYEQT